MAHRYLLQSEELDILIHSRYFPLPIEVDAEHDVFVHQVEVDPTLDQEQINIDTQTLGQASIVVANFDSQNVGFSADLECAWNNIASDMGKRT